MKALERYDYFYGDSFKVEFPTGSGNMMRLKDTSVEIATRLSKLFIPDANGRRPCHGDDEICLLYTSPSPRDLSTSRMPSSA